MHDKEECCCVECCLVRLEEEPKIQNPKSREKLVRDKIPEIIRSKGQLMHDKDTCCCVECCLVRLENERKATFRAREKLVRDKIPEIIRGKGQFCTLDEHYRKADPEEMQALLVTKLHEEVKEYVNGYDPNELADIMEVVLALADLAGLSERKLEQMRLAKVDERGDFTNRFVLFLK